MTRMLKNVGIWIQRPPKLVLAFWLAFLPIPLLGAALYACHHLGVLGDSELGIGLAISLLVAWLGGTRWMNRIDACLSSADPQSELNPIGPKDDLGCDKALFDIFMDHLPALTYLKDHHGRYIYVNSACRKMWQRLPQEVIGRNDDEIWPEAMARPLCQNDAQVIGSDEIFTAVNRLTVGSEERYHLMTKFVVDSSGQRMLGGVTVDITDKVRAEEENARLEEQLIQSQKMEAIGTLAGGIAHDFNNILAAILGYVELAQMDLNPSSPVQYELTQVLKATHRARDLVRQILTFSRKTEHDRQPLDPVPLVEEVLTMLRASIPSTIVIRPRYYIAGIQVMANATQFHQVMMNLCTNAAHAMEETGGMLEVDLSKVDITGNTTDRQGLAPGSYLEVKVRDNGPGIAPGLRERIFDPYFTTKALGRGSGMGLAVTRSIVESHGGTIKVESRPGDGACFSLRLPASIQSATIVSSETETLPCGTESILFVDDEPTLADLGKQMLSRLGYQVTSCHRSTEALELVKNNPDGFDLVITDTTMPTMTGDVLATRLHAIRNHLPVILCTGYSEQMTEEAASRLNVSAFLMKPLSIRKLALTLRSVLDAPSPVSANDRAPSFGQPLRPVEATAACQLGNVLKYGAGSSDQ